MTVALELAKSGHRMEYFLAIEGLGWAVDEADLSQGFEGTVFCVQDQDGDLASKLGSSIKENLHLPSGVSDRFDPATYEYRLGQMSFRLVDLDNFLLGNISPFLTSGTDDTLGANLFYDNTVVDVNTPGSWSNGDVIWVADREAIKLGTKAGSVFNGSTRGYAGTPRGRYDSLGIDGGKEFAWDGSATVSKATVIRSWNRQWVDRSVALYMHVPGEASVNSVRIYSGRIRTIKTSLQGAEWIINTSTDNIGRFNRRYYNKQSGSIKFEQFIDASGRPIDYNGQLVPSSASATPSTGEPVGVPATTMGVSEIQAGARRIFRWVEDQSSRYHFNALKAIYNYRNRVKGGTVGMITGGGTTPQATTSSDTPARRQSGRLISIAGNYIRVLSKAWDPDNSNEPEHRILTAEVQNLNLGTTSNSLFEDGTECAILLDNFLESFQFNPFTLDGDRVTRNPIDVMLMFFTSMNSEFQVFDGIGGTMPNVNTGLTMVTNEWEGFALHRVEGAAAVDVGESRVIKSNTSGGVVVVDRAMSNNSGITDEFQIRNTIYDVLPYGWGMGIHHTHIDITSFEDVRDRFLGDAQLGKWAIGESETIDMWRLLVDNICMPYGLSVYVARNGKLTCRYVGESELQDGLDSAYTALTAADLFHVGDIELATRPPTGQIDLTVRDVSSYAIRPISFTSNSIFPHIEDTVVYGEIMLADPGINGKTHTIPIWAPENESSSRDERANHLKFTSVFHTELDAAPLIGRLLSRMAKEATPGALVQIKVPLSHIPSTIAGDVRSITDTTKFNPVNPFTALRGWNPMIARVVGTRIDFDESLYVLDLELLDSITGCLIAPAVDCSSKGTSGSGSLPEFFAVHFGDNTADFQADTDELDWKDLLVNDRIVLRTVDGSPNTTGGGGGLYIIESFGTNEASTPAAADSGRINVTAASIVETVNSTDYLALSTWSTSNTTNMDKFAGLADASETLGSGNDVARQYH